LIGFALQLTAGDRRILSSLHLHAAQSAAETRSPDDRRILYISAIEHRARSKAARVDATDPQRLTRQIAILTLDLTPDLVAKNQDTAHFTPPGQPRARRGSQT